MAKRSSVDDFMIDFSKEVETSGGGVRVKPGTYRVKIVSAKPITSEEKGTKGLELMLQILEGPSKGKKLRERVWASPKALSRFRHLLEACGKRVPSRVELGKIAVAVKGCEIAVEVDDEEREGYKTRSRVTFEGFIHIDDYEESDDEEDEEDDTDDDELDLDEDDEEDEEEEPEPPKRRRKAAKSPAKRKRRQADDDDDDEDDLDELDLEDL